MPRPVLGWLAVWDMPFNCSRTVLRDPEDGFTLIELLIVMLVVGLLVGGGLSMFGSFQERTWRAEADAAWEELDMTVRLFRVGTGHWPAQYLNVNTIREETGGVGLAGQSWGALAVNLAPSDAPDAAAEEMRGRPGTGGPTTQETSGYIVLAGGRVCVWYEGVPATSNDGRCP